MLKGKYVNGANYRNPEDVNNSKYANEIFCNKVGFSLINIYWGKIMNERYIKLQIESVVNKLLYRKNIIEKKLYEETSKKLDKLIFEENKK